MSNESQPTPSSPDNQWWGQDTPKTPEASLAWVQNAVQISGANLNLGNTGPELPLPQFGVPDFRGEAETWFGAPPVTDSLPVTVHPLKKYREDVMHLGPIGLDRGKLSPPVQPKAEPWFETPPAAGTAQELAVPVPDLAQQPGRTPASKGAESSAPAKPHRRDTAPEESGVVLDHLRGTMAAKPPSGDDRGKLPPGYQALDDGAVVRYV